MGYGYAVWSNRELDPLFPPCDYCPSLSHRDSTPTTNTHGNLGGPDRSRSAGKVGNVERSNPLPTVHPDSPRGSRPQTKLPAVLVNAQADARIV